MSITISSSLPAETFAANTVPANSAAAQPAAQPVRIVGDTVQLTVAQEVYQLYNQGQQISQIASRLRLSVEAVNGFLGISSAKL